MYQTSERTLDAPDLVDDYYLNLLDWGSSNVLAIALGGTVYLWDASDGSTSELVTLEDETGPVTSVSWAPDGRHIAIGLNNSDVQLWDSTANRLVWISTLNWTLNLRCSSGFSPVSDDLLYDFLFLGVLISAAENSERWPRIKGGLPGLEQSRPYNWRNGW